MITFTAKLFDGEHKVTIQTARYPNGTRAWQLCEVDTGAPMLRATVSLEAIKPQDGCVFIKDWSENEGLWEALVAACVIAPEPVRVYLTGHVEVKEARVISPSLI